MHAVWQDLKTGIRSLRGGGLLILVAVLSLGIGIGSVTTIFSAVDVFMLRPLPYPDSHDLYAIHTTNPVRGWTEVWLSPPDFRDYRERSVTMEGRRVDRSGLQPVGERTTGEDPGPSSELELPPGARRRAGCRTQLPPGGGGRGTPPPGDHQSRSVAAALRRGSVGDRLDARARRGAPRDRRGHAGGLLVRIHLRRRLGAARLHRRRAAQLPLPAGHRARGGRAHRRTGER